MAKLKEEHNIGEDPWNKIIEYKQKFENDLNSSTDFNPSIDCPDNSLIDEGT